MCFVLKYSLLITIPEKEILAINIDLRLGLLTNNVCFASIAPMLKIRLQRTGRKHEPTYRVVLTESKNGPQSGKFKEILGSYDARVDKKELNADRISYWMTQGVQVSGTVHNMLVSEGIVKGKKINVLSKKSPIIDEEKIKAEAEAKAAEEEAKEKARLEAEEAAKAADLSAGAEDAAAAPSDDQPTKSEEKTAEASIEEKQEETPKEAQAPEEKKD